MATNAQIDMLSNAVRGRSLVDGIKGQSAHGGASQTEFSLRKRGWLTRDNKVTEEGAKELIGTPISAKHKYFDGFGWKEETIEGTFRSIHLSNRGDLISGMMQSNKGGGFDFYVDPNRDYRHGRY